MVDLYCKSPKRRHKLRQQEELNGLDYLEVSDDQLTLTAFFLNKAPKNLSKEHIRIIGGRRVTDIEVLNVEVLCTDLDDRDDCLKIHINKPGDFSCYKLCIVKLDDKQDCPTDCLHEDIVKLDDEQDCPTNCLHEDFDPRYACLEFTFKANCPSDLDCAQSICPTEPLPQPEINYLAKDYASFRQLILDRFSLLVPDWQERHVPDLGIALVEVLAYVGDYLSYYQDAVATEAYLDTARQRISVRRHARLVDYVMHEGCNARTWVQLRFEGDSSHKQDLNKLAFITNISDLISKQGSLLKTDDLRNISKDAYVWFEPIKEEICLYANHNEIHFYTWENELCCLPKGSTSATLIDNSKPISKSSTQDKDDKVAESDTDSTLTNLAAPLDETQTETPNPEKRELDATSPLGNIERKDVTKTRTIYIQETQKKSESDIDPSSSEEDKCVEKEGRTLNLKCGDVLIFEEVLGPKTGNSADANPMHRHAVRLTKVTENRDPLCEQPLVEIEWKKEDALPFPLCLSSETTDCKTIENVSVARGNIILVDHGRSIGPELLGEVRGKELESCDECGEKTTSVTGRFRPSLKEVPLTFHEPINMDKPASMVLQQDPRQAKPAIEDLVSSVANPNEGTSEQEKAKEILDQGDTKWTPVPDLIASNSSDTHFVTEINNEGGAQLRFGDGELGQSPQVGHTFAARYRVGNGIEGNIGAEAITHVVTDETISGITLKPRNPFPAQGGTNPEPIEEVKLFAPFTFGEDLQRAITPQDYADLAERDFDSDVQRAAAQLRWTGSWYEMRLAIDAEGQPKADSELLTQIEVGLERYRRIGHDLRAVSAKNVPLCIALNVCVSPHYQRGHVKAALLELFSNRLLPNGKKGFFHPDNLTFGEGVLVSRLVAEATAVQGVDNVVVEKLERLYEPSNSPNPNESESTDGDDIHINIKSGVLPLGPFEVARLDNDPSFPENGQLEIKMGGGR